MPKIKTVRRIEDRLIQKAEGYRATIVNGAVTVENGEANGVDIFYGHTTINGKPMRVWFVGRRSQAAPRAGNRPIRQMQERRGKRTGPWNFDARCEPRL